MGEGVGVEERESMYIKRENIIKIEVYNFFNASNALPPSPILS